MPRCLRRGGLLHYYRDNSELAPCIWPHKIVSRKKLDLSVTALGYVLWILSNIVAEKY